MTAEEMASRFRAKSALVPVFLIRDHTEDEHIGVILKTEFRGPLDDLMIRVAPFCFVRRIGASRIERAQSDNGRPFVICRG